jgi:multidrug resistance efflux pump
VKDRTRVVLKCAPRSFRLAEHVVSVRGGKLNADTQLSAHAAGLSYLKYRVPVDFRIGAKALDEEWYRACMC